MRDRADSAARQTFLRYLRTEPVARARPVLRSLAADRRKTKPHPAWEPLNVGLPEPCQRAAPRAGLLQLAARIVLRHLAALVPSSLPKPASLVWRSGEAQLSASGPNLELPALSVESSSARQSFGVRQP